MCVRVSLGIWTRLSAQHYVATLKCTTHRIAQVYVVWRLRLCWIPKIRSRKRTRLVGGSLRALMTIRLMNIVVHLEWNKRAQHPRMYVRYFFRSFVVHVLISLSTFSSSLFSVRVRRLLYSGIIHMNCCVRLYVNALRNI